MPFPRVRSRRADRACRVTRPGRYGIAPLRKHRAPRSPIRRSPRRDPQML